MDVMHNEIPIPSEGRLRVRRDPQTGLNTYTYLPTGQKVSEELVSWCLGSGQLRWIKDNDGDWLGWVE